VDDLDLTQEELRRVLAACRFLRVGTPAPGYLREFLARRLEESSLDGLAARVRQSTDGLMEALWERVRQEQDRGLR
jgi:hypothetical protein